MWFLVCIVTVFCLSVFLCYNIVKALASKPDCLFTPIDARVIDTSMAMTLTGFVFASMFLAFDFGVKVSFLPSAIWTIVAGIVVSFYANSLSQVPILRCLFIKNHAVFEYSDSTVVWCARILSLTYSVVTVVPPYVFANGIPTLMNYVYEKDIEMDFGNLFAPVAILIELLAAGSALALIIQEKKRLGEDYSKDKKHAIFLMAFLVSALSAMSFNTSMFHMDKRDEFVHQFVLVTILFMFVLGFPFLYIYNRF